MANLIGERKSLRFGFVWGVLALLLFSLSVFGDVFPHERSTKPLGKNRLELTPYSSIHFFLRRQSDGKSEHYADEYGARMGYGLLQNLDVRLQYNLTRTVWGTDGGPDYIHHFFMFGLKRTMIKDQLALYLPVSFTRGDSDGTFYTLPISFMTDQIIHPRKTWTFHPTLFFGKKTEHASEFEWNSAITVSIPRKNSYIDFSGGRTNFIFFDFNLGMGMYLIPNRLALMSEILYQKNLKNLDELRASTVTARIRARINLISDEVALWPTLNLREDTFHFRMGITYCP